VNDAPVLDHAALNTQKTRRCCWRFRACIRQGIDTLLKALVQLPRHVSVAGGDGPERGALEKWRSS